MNIIDEKIALQRVENYFLEMDIRKMIVDEIFNNVEYRNTNGKCLPTISNELRSNITKYVSNNPIDQEIRDTFEHYYSKTRHFKIALTSTIQCLDLEWPNMYWTFLQQ